MSRLEIYRISRGPVFSAVKFPNDNPLSEYNLTAWLLSHIQALISWRNFMFPQNVRQTVANSWSWQVFV